MIVVEPIALTEDTAVLRLRYYDALIKAYEDAADALALADVRAREAAGTLSTFQSRSPRRFSWPRSIRCGSGACLVR